MCKKVVLLIKIGHACVALKQENDFSLKTSEEINFEGINVVNYLPLT